MSEYRCNTVPIEKGTETFASYGGLTNGLGDATPSPSRRGLKREYGAAVRAAQHDATPSPSRRGLKQAQAQIGAPINCARCNTVPIEKGTETNFHRAADRLFGLMQHRPHREGD